MFSMKSTFLFFLIGLLLPVSTFASSLPKEKENEFHFVILGDSLFHDPAKFNRVVDQTKLLMPAFVIQVGDLIQGCLLYTSPSPRDLSTSRMPSSA